MRRACILMMLARAGSFGAGNSTLRSIRPLRSNAGSNVSGLFVAPMIYKCALIFSIVVSNYNNDVL